MPKSTPTRVDIEMVRDWALGTLGEWMPGYTDVLGDGMQRKLTLEEELENGIVLAVQTLGRHGGHVGAAHKFTITIEVKEE